MSLAQSDSSLAREVTLTEIQGLLTDLDANTPPPISTVPGNTTPGVPVRVIDGKFFQVINETGDDWDEELTMALYQSHLDNNLVGKIKNWFMNIFGNRE